MFKKHFAKLHLPALVQQSIIKSNIGWFVIAVLDRSLDVNISSKKHTSRFMVPNESLDVTVNKAKLLGSLTWQSIY